jgi:hypothetical protein
MSSNIIYYNLINRIQFIYLLNKLVFNLLYEYSNNNQNDKHAYASTTELYSISFFIAHCRTLPHSRTLPHTAVHNAVHCMN